jgi:hypothetical protein
MSTKLRTSLNIILVSWILVTGLLMTLAIAVTITRGFHQEYPKEGVDRAADVDILRTSSLAPDYFQRDPELRQPMKLIDFSIYSLVEEDIASLTYMSRLNKCFDLPFRELASCHTLLDQ